MIKKKKSVIISRQSAEIALDAVNALIRADKEAQIPVNPDMYIAHDELWDGLYEGR